MVNRRIQHKQKVWELACSMVVGNRYINLLDHTFRKKDLHETVNIIWDNHFYSMKKKKSL